MGRKKISAATLQKEIKRILNQYGEVTWNNVDEATKKVAKKTRTAVANESKQFDAGDRWGKGKYSHGWRIKEDRGLWWTSYIVHQKNKPFETHLLEYGHELTIGAVVPPRNKGGVPYINKKPRAKAYPHIAPVAEKVPREMEKEVLDAIRRSV